MKRYDTYKDSGVQWLGEIPGHWECVKLKMFCQDNKEKNKGNIESCVLSLSYGNIIVKKNVNFGLVPENYDSYQIVNPANIILRLTDLQNDHKSLRTGLVKNRGIITSAYVGLIVKNMNSEYTQLILHSYDVMKVFYGMGGGLRQSMSYTDIANVYIPVPPLSEQRSIVSFLDAKCGKIDEWVTKKQKEVEHLQELKQRVIADAVTRGLNPHVKMKTTNIPWLKEIPEHWERTTLRKFLRLFSVKNHGDKQLLSVTREQGVIVRDIESKEGNHNFIPDDLSGYKYVQIGDFVINKMKSWQGSYGVSNYEGIVSPAYYTCKLEGIDRTFFSLAIRSKIYVSFFGRYSKGIRVDQWDLSPFALTSIPFAVPPLSEQEQIVSYLDAKCAKIDKLIANITKEIECIKEYKQRLISDVVTGQIKVC